MSTYINQQLKATGVAQVIVVLKSAPAASGAVAAATLGRAAAVGPSFAPPETPGLAGIEQYFTQSELSQASALAEVGLAHASTKLGVAARSRRRSPTPPASRFYPNLGVMFGTVDRGGLSALRSDNRVAAVAGAPQISLIHPTRSAAANLATKVTWGLEFMNVPRLWKEGLTGKGIKVGHLDTGVDGKHPALKKAVEGFVEFDLEGNMVNPSPAPHDSDDHGTHTAATIAGRPVNGRSVGVAREAELSSAMVIEGGVMVARVLGGMDWALSQGIQILNMSLGFRGWWEDFIPIIDILRSQNVLPVIAVGNEYAGTSRSPGNYPNVLSVGAHDENKLVADFSSSQRFKRAVDPIVPDMVAPGVGVISASPGGGYKSNDGSSMATPHVAGLCALLMQAKPTATIDEIEDAILRSCTLGAGMFASRANRGYPDAIKALAILTGHDLSASKGSKKAANNSTKKSASKKSARKSSKSSKKSSRSKKGKKTTAKKR
ncbi:MAG TPA: S8 family serine peptidase [Pyrinomonadaceae bacterium]|nr:S8 family serine peptidase [Pyrinomonadaceae bacterium]